MISNFFKVIYRHIIKERLFSITTIFGLTLSFFCFIVIALYIHDELNFDNIHKDANNIYRVIRHEKAETGEIKSIAQVPGKIAQGMVDQFPEVESAIRLIQFGSLTMGNDPMTRGYEYLTLADSTFFQFFDFKLLQGDPSTALNNPDGIVVSQKLAKRYFGTEDVMGKVIWANGLDMTIAGVMQDFPSNSHLQLDLLFSERAVDKHFPRYRIYEPSDWSNNISATYIKVGYHESVSNLESKLTSLVKDNYPVDRDFNSTFTLQPLLDIHLKSENIEDYQINPSGFNTFYIYMFTVVAFLILLIASLNYMNLSTAAAFKRTREIGTRKTLGAGKLSLIGQFVGEALILSLFSLVIAIALVQAFSPYINNFTGKTLLLQYLDLPWMAGIGIVLILFGLLASLYPALIVSKVSPAEAIKKEVRIANRSLPMRKVLVVAQFAVSIMMISSTLVIYRQLNYMRQKSLGFNVENLVAIDINSGIQRRQFESYKTELSRLPEVKSVTVSSRVPGEWKRFPIANVNLVENPLPTEMIFVGIDQDFLHTFDLQLREGRNFNAGAGDSTKVLLTRLAVEQLGLENPIGQKITIPSVSFGGLRRDFEQPFEAEVIGVVDDFYFESFRTKMKPLIFAYYNNPIHSIDYYTLRIQTRDWDRTLTSIKEINNQFDTNNPIEYNFLDTKFNEFYHSDEKRGQVFVTFSGVIVLIACMGLFALVTFAVENRRKEIGVRKVLGASTNNIVSLISREFILLVLVAFVIAIPLVIATMNSWLSEFAYHVNFGVGTFALAGGIAIVIAFVTISIRSLKAAKSNPVDSLRSE